MRLVFYDDPDYKLKQSIITKRAWRDGKLNSLIKPHVKKRCKNPACNKIFSTKPYDPKIYCSHSCSAAISNPKRKHLHFCFTCQKEIKRSSYKYCSNYCQWNNYYKQYIARWKHGLENGVIGINTKTISAYLRHYLKEKYNDKCSKCGWDQKHPKTLVVPLEINHIDGNAENNKEDNLELLCPNCHALTPNFRNLNKGNGRNWRLRKLRS
ncbi:MAG: HNH endonuclease [uncultured bacterium]|uniref:HNH endonuclease n=1 Tax=Candidatus Daviesbacteria bacterium GW2011_GWC2_40_12 TaxID=1618431 RepID=A0A0G0QNU8_9BACT|nr:MAG: HNH endonuclease [uncultured bacterium]KKQ84833.1 MAG: HNH endonuclease [Candidatus Daviesbacteria bacterium GW2011_GWF2_38_7]KKR16533.1 MAG: HNH endonuclease [Candidatus Daviesbacteria bacterium GW2011_GWA2_39_33]KKR41798.1 MAG: HNH endonuclease [Candidatus Daviesbacteria bacterium GW2011_GWC2_40_12]OGE21123.1 MAG: hypothetical protein A2778_02750 [Candidatus Daviesbacteria bacterium RIFCSPHIGHO2_01_FULL_40_24]OGE28965.1 MAG: hypothetical protein A3C29_06360 [Candidatus Daviesbacteria